MYLYNEIKRDGRALDIQIDGNRNDYFRPSWRWGMDQSLNPNPQEILFVSNLWISLLTIKAALDEGERARIEVDEAAPLYK